MIEAKQYLLIDMEAFPPGWTNEQRHNGHKYCVETVANQSPVNPHLKTHSRPNKPTVFDVDEEGNETINEDGETVVQYILAGQVSLADSDDIIYAIAAGIWGEPPSDGNLLAVTNKIEITELTHDDVLAMLAGNAEFWGEVQA